MGLDSLKAFPKGVLQKQTPRIFSNSSIPETRIELSKVISVEDKHIMLPFVPYKFCTCAGLDLSRPGHAP